MTWVFAALVTAFGQAWVDSGVYMPGCRAKDPQRRAKAGIPGKLASATKPELAIAQAKRLMTAGVRAMWAAAGEVYGRSGEFRETLRALSLAYVVIIPRDYRVTAAKNTVIRAGEAISGAVFERRSCGNGTKDPRYGGWDACRSVKRPRGDARICRIVRASGQALSSSRFGGVSPTCCRGGYRWSAVIHFSGWAGLAAARTASASSADRVR